MPLCHEHRCLVRDKFRNIFNGLDIRQPPPTGPNWGMLNTIDLVLRPERRLDFAFPVFGAGRG
jgi:hypothetical protein